MKTEKNKSGHERMHSSNYHTNASVCRKEWGAVSHVRMLEVISSF
jgi:hypothetical protein